MVETGFHFAQPIWLWGLLLVPLVIAWLLYSSPFRQHGQEAKYADPELMPYLSGMATTRSVRSRRPLLAWVVVWSLLSMAMAGPRWDFRQMNPFDPGADLVILLDISRSMDVADVNPSRLDRARHEIQDLIRSNPGMSVGLIAFATIAHVVTPITEDGESLLRQLPAISTDLVRLQGSRLSDAIDRATQLLDGQGEDVAHNILLISDGDFAETGIEQKVSELYERGTRFHILAVGTGSGGPVPGVMAANREPVLSWVDEDKLRQLADAGGGKFRLAGYRADDIDDIFAAIMSHAKTKQNEKLQTLVWNEYYYWLLVPAILMLLFLFRPGAGASNFGQSERA
jgi:Ca-activated chloride channel family protein